jgi:hypothetical protein
LLRLATLTLSLAACGRVAFDETRDGSALDIDSVVDAAPLLPFGPRQALTAISNATEDDPTLTADGLEIIFESTRAGGCGAADLWWSQRAALDQPFAPPLHLPTLCTASDDEHPGFSPDGLTIYFASNRGGGAGAYDIWKSTRPIRGSSAWSAPVNVTELNDAGDIEGPQPVADDLTMVLAVGPNSVDEQVHVTTRATPSDPWSPTVPLSAVDVNLAATTDSAPAMSGDRRALYFSSNRGDGTHRIYRAERVELTDPFGPAVHVSELSPTSASDPWISPDERIIVFASMGQIYEARRQ